MRGMPSDAKHGAVRRQATRPGHHEDDGLYLGTVLVGADGADDGAGLVDHPVDQGGPVREALETVWLVWGGMPADLRARDAVPAPGSARSPPRSRNGREADEEDVLLSVDEAGVLSRRRTTADDPVVRRPRPVPGRAPRRHRRRSWHPYLIVLRYDDDALPRNSKAWGPSVRGPAPTRSSAVRSPSTTCVRRSGGARRPSRSPTAAASRTEPCSGEGSVRWAS